MELSFEGLNKQYGDKRALIDFTLRMGSGIHGILGPNGAGKSTLMNILTGNLAPTSGEIRFDGQSIFDRRSRFGRRVGYMPQSCRIYEDFTGTDFMLYMAALKNLPPAEAKRQIAYYLRQVELTADAGRKTGAYSGGMKRRLLLAATLLGRPDIMVLDEPTAGLDPRQRIHMRNLIARASAGKITIIATHVVSDIESIAHDLILMNEGRIIRFDDPPALLCSGENRVYEVDVRSISERLLNDDRVSNLRTLPNGRVRVRLVLRDGQRPPRGAAPVMPDLEDIYLYYFGRR